MLKFSFWRAVRPQTRVVLGALTACVAAGALLGGCGGGSSGPGGGSGAGAQTPSETLGVSVGSAGSFDIYAAFADGRAQLRLTDDAARDTEPALSPDRRRIAFISTRGGQTDLYLMNADGSAVERLTDDAVAEDEPAWSPDGTRLAFRAFSDETFRADIVILDVATRERRNLTPRRRERPLSTTTRQPGVPTQRASPTPPPSI